MKKVITLVLALVMVLGIAASASALVPEHELITVNGSDRYDLAIELVGGTVTGGATLTVPAVSAGKAYVVNEIVYYAITLTAKGKYDGTTTNNLSELTIAGNGVNIVDYAKSIGVLVYNATKGTWDTVKIDAADKVNNGLIKNSVTFKSNALNTKLVAQNKIDTTYVIFGYGLVTNTATNPTITVTVGINSLVEGVLYMTTSGNYKIAKFGERDWCVQTKVNGVAYAIRFKALKTGLCNSISYQQIADFGQANPAGAWKEVTKGDYVSGGSYYYGWIDEVKAPIAGNVLTAIENVFTFMGFDYSLINTNAVLESDFVAKTAEPALKAVATLNAYNDIVTVDTITPVIDIVPPKTGSNASIIGIAMIVVAAAAAFVCKKVRA